MAADEGAARATGEAAAASGAAVGEAAAPAPGPRAATVRQLIEQQARTQPDSIYAVSTAGETLTYRQLAASCRAVAHKLDALGSGPGAHVSLVMPNGIGTLSLLLGALHGGRCVNPVNLLSQPAQMRYVLEHADADIVLVAPDWVERVREMVAALPRPLQVVEVDPDAPFPPLDGDGEGALAPGSEHVSPDSLALLMYTSGTTGLPKGVMLTQANLAASAHAISAEHGLAAHDRVHAVLPLFHINAFAVTMLAPLAHGGSLLMAPKFSAAAFWQQAVEHRCTWINVVPTIISYLLEGAAPPQDDLRNIRFCRSASAALPPEHHRAFERKFGIGIVETMGLTETVAPSFSNPMQPAERRLGSVGRASGCEARVAGADGRTLSDGQTGEILLRGPQVMKGYYKNDAATRAAFHADGWLRTGDLGHRDGDGFFFVTGRIKELIIKGGENIAPREIDEALLGHPAVLEAAAVGIPDRHYGQEIMACVVLREGRSCSENEMREYCLDVLGRYKTPRVIRFVAELPRGPSGKVQRLKLTDLLDGEAASAGE